MGMAGWLPLCKGMSVMSRPNIEGTRHLMGPGPGEPQGLHSACPTPSSKPCTHTTLTPPPSLGKQPGDWHPLSWPQPTWGHVPTSPRTAGGWLKGVGVEFELGVSVRTPLQALLQAYLPTGHSTPRDQEEPLLSSVL